MPERLVDRIALVMDGGPVARGIGNGKACALECARRGAASSGVDRSDDTPEQSTRLNRYEGGTSRMGASDVSIDDDIERLVAECMAAFGQIDVLHSNVVRIDFGDVTELIPAPRNASSSVNPKSVLPTRRHVIPRMRAPKTAAIVNISSIAATRYPGVPYMLRHAGKAGTVQLTLTLAVRHVVDGIRANTLPPGLVDTPHVHAFPRDPPGGGDTETKICRRISLTPVGRMGTDRGVASAAAFPASDEATFITGTELVVDGDATATAIS